MPESFYSNFPIRPAARSGRVPVIFCRALNTTTKKVERIPVSLGIRFPGDISQHPEALQPIGFERSVMVQMPDGSFRTFKGAGERDQGNRYFDRIGKDTRCPNPKRLVPFCVNPRPSFATHALIGGGTEAILRFEFDQSQRLLEMVQQLGCEPGGLPRPVGVYRLLEIPVISQDGQITLKAPSRLRLGQPAVYAYDGRMAPRIGNAFMIISNADGLLRDLLIEKGKITESRVLDTRRQKRLKETQPDIYEPFRSLPVDADAGMENASIGDIKEIVDELIIDLYASAGIGIRVPEKTDQDLRTAQGRLLYLTEVRALNKAEAEALTNIFAAEVGRQLGVIHGSGGHVGGSSDVDTGGRLMLHFRDRKGITYKLIAKFENNEPQEFYWEGAAPKDGFRGLTLTRIIDTGKNFREEFGPEGGGSTRTDNVGIFGLRDFDTLCLSGRDEPLDSLVRQVPDQLKSSKRMRQYIKFYYLMMKQKIDAQHLSCIKTRFSMVYFPGAFMHFTALVGGGRNEFYGLRDKFQAEYFRWRKLAQERYAPAWFKHVLTRKVVLDYIFQHNLIVKENRTVDEFFGYHPAPSRPVDDCMDYVERLRAIGY